MDQLLMCRIQQAARKNAIVLLGSGIFGSSFFDPDTLWKTKFSAVDPVVAVVHDGKTVLFISDLEYGRAEKTSRADKIIRVVEFMEKNNLPKTAKASEILSVYLKQQGITDVTFAPFFSLAVDLAKEFRVTTPADGRLFSERAVKTPDEIAEIEKVRDVTESVMLKVFDAIAKMDIRDGKIFDTDGLIGVRGEYLMAEVARGFMNREFIDKECLCPDAIIASGDQAVDPHCIGIGPLLANVPIVFDIFPCSMRSHYWYDTTRTVVKGKLSSAALRLYECVKEAQALGLSRMRPGAVGCDIHNEIKTFFESHDYQTGMLPAIIDGKEKMEMQGFTHGTGHGVGIDIHEHPRVNSIAKDVLEPGMMPTCEPGLYYYGIGGARIEDTVVIIKDGYRNLSLITKDLIEL